MTNRIPVVAGIGVAGTLLTGLSSSFLASTGDTMTLGEAMIVGFITGVSMIAILASATWASRGIR